MSSDPLCHWDPRLIRLTWSFLQPRCVQLEPAVNHNTRMERAWHEFHSDEWVLTRELEDWYVPLAAYPFYLTRKGSCEPRRRVGQSAFEGTLCGSRVFLWEATNLVSIYDVATGRLVHTHPWIKPILVLATPRGLLLWYHDKVQICDPCTLELRYSWVPANYCHAQTCMWHDWLYLGEGRMVEAYTGQPCHWSGENPVEHAELAWIEENQRLCVKSGTSIRTWAFQ